MLTTSKKSKRKHRIRKKRKGGVSPRAWNEFLQMEFEVISKVGLEAWNEYLPVHPKILREVCIHQRRCNSLTEIRAAEALRHRGIFPEFQVMVLNRMVVDWALMPQKILIEVDGQSHLDDLVAAKDKKKDAFVKNFGFITFRLKHPCSMEERQMFCDSVKEAFIERGGVPFDVKPRIEPRRIDLPRQHPVKLPKPISFILRKKMRGGTL